MGKLYDMITKYMENPTEKVELLPDIVKGVQEIESSEAALTDRVSTLYDSNLRLAKMVSVPPEPNKEPEMKEPEIPTLQELAKDMLQAKLEGVK